MKMKKRYAALAVLFLLLFCVMFFDQAVISAAKWKLSKLFPESRISIAGFSTDLFSNADFYGVRIEKPKEYDLRVKKVSAEYSLASVLKGNFLQFWFESDILRFKDIEAEGIMLHISPDSEEGTFRIKRLKYNKVLVSGINAHPRMRQNSLYLERLSASLFGGDIKGEVQVQPEQPLVYQAKLDFSRLDIARCIQELELKKKLEMTGRIDGSLSVQGKGAHLKILSAKLNSREGGGVLVVKDKAFLKNLANRTNQPVDLLVENLTDYHYNKADATVSLEKSDIVLKTLLEGEAGDRDFTIVLHEVNMEGKR